MVDNGPRRMKLIIEDDEGRKTVVPFVRDEITIGRWLGRFGLTRLQPRPYHPKKDPAAQEAFKKTSVSI